MTATDTLPEKSKKETKSLIGPEDLGSSTKHYHEQQEDTELSVLESLQKEDNYNSNISDEELSYYSDDRSGDSSSLMSENSESLITEKQGSLQESKGQERKSNLKRESRIYGTELNLGKNSRMCLVRLKLSKWNEPSAMVARLSTLLSSQSPTEYCIDTALKFA
jgi:hypothetical protein